MNPFKRVHLICQKCLADEWESAEATGRQSGWKLGRQLEPDEGPEECEWCGGITWDEAIYTPPPPTLEGAP